MKIAILLPDLRGGGAERISLDLAREFARAGHAIEIVLMRAEGEFLAEAQDAFPIRNLDIDWLRHLPWVLSRYFRDHRPDALIAAMWPVTVCAALGRILSRHRCSLVLVEHNMLSIQYREKSWLHRLVLRLSMAFGYRAADVGVGVSVGVVEDMARLGAIPAARLHVVYNPIMQRPLLDQDLLRPVDQLWGCPGGRRILAVGRLKAQKNYPLLLNAFARLPYRPDTKLMLLGGGDAEAVLRAQATKLGIADRVIFAGFHPDPTPFYQTADLFVLSSDYEGLPTVIIEALACGVPVVATDCPSGPAEILDGGKYGTLVPVGDAAALAEAMANALGQPYDRDALRRRAMDFSPDRAAARYLELLG